MYKVSEDIELECKDALANFGEWKSKRNQLIKILAWVQIQFMRVSLLKQLGVSGQPIPWRPIDKSTTSKPNKVLWIPNGSMKKEKT